GVCFDYPFEVTKRNGDYAKQHFLPRNTRHTSSCMCVGFPRSPQSRTRVRSWGFAASPTSCNSNYLGCIFNAFRKINGQTIKNAYSGLNIEPVKNSDTGVKR